MPTQTFPLTPYFTVNVDDIGFVTDISKGFGGKTWRDSVASVSFLQFSFSISAIKAVDLPTFVAFMQARKGSLEAFNFIFPNPWNAYSSTPYLVYYPGAKISWSWVKRNIGSAQIVFVEDK